MTEASCWLYCNELSVCLLGHWLQCINVTWCTQHIVPRMSRSSPNLAIIFLLCCTMKCYIFTCTCTFGWNKRISYFCRLQYCVPLRRKSVKLRWCFNVCRFLLNPALLLPWNLSAECARFVNGRGNLQKVYISQWETTELSIHWAKLSSK